MTDTDELPIFIVEGANWKCEARLDEDDLIDENNKPLSAIEIAIEAATKGIELIHGDLEGDYESLDGDGPYLGTSVLVHIKGEKPESGIYIKSYIALGNGGYYEESKLAQEQYEKDLKNSKPKKSKKK